MTGEDIRTAHGYEIRTRYSPREERYQTALYRDGEKVWHSFEDTFEEAVSLAEEMALRLNEKRATQDDQHMSDDLITCPYCNRVGRCDAEFEVSDGRLDVRKCWACKHLFVVTKHVHVTYTSERIKENNP